MSYNFKNLKKDEFENNSIIVEAMIEKTRSKSLESYYDFFGDICDYVVENQLKYKQIKTLLEPFSKDHDMVDVIIMLCKDYIAPKKTVKYIVSNLNDLGSPIDFLTKYFYERNYGSYSEVAENILYCFDYNLTNQDIENLMENLEDYIQLSRNQKNNDIISYLKSKKTFVEEDYEKPEWVSIISGENVSLLATVPVEESEDSEEYKFGEIPPEVDEFSFQFVNDKITGDKEMAFSELSKNVKKSLESYLQMSNKIESNESKMKIGSSFRVWGPINKIEGVECSGSPHGKGPCRMFLCNCLANFEDEEDTGSNPGWFNGKCDGCGDFIRDISHSVRFPHRNGGWKGWFCSFKCMIEKSPYIIKTEENILIGIMKQNLETLGIMDRSVFC